jgi:hypothetical protein
MCQLSHISGFEVGLHCGQRSPSAAKFALRSLPKSANARALFGKFCLTPRKVNEFVTLAITHSVDGHARQLRQIAAEQYTVR